MTTPPTPSTPGAVRFGMGCVGLGTASGGRTFGHDVRLVRAALDAGVSVLDTAGAYGAGMSEQVIGAALRGRRHEVILATKGGYVVRPRHRAEFVVRREVVRLRGLLDRRRRRSGGAADERASASYAAQDFSESAMRSALEASLRRLRTDHVDVYQLHGPPPVLDDVMPTLQRFVDEGKVRRLGIGAETFDAAQAWSNVAGIATVQLPIGVLDPEARPLVSEIGRRGREVWARGVFGGGLLASATRGDGSARHDPKWPLVEALARLADEHGVSLFHLAYGFVRAIPGVSTIVLGMSRRQHLDDDAAIVAAPALSDELLSAIDELLAATGDRAGVDGP